MAKTDFEAKRILDHISGVAAYTPGTIYMGLSSTAPTDAGGNVTEPSGGGYARINMAGKWAAAALDTGEMTTASSEEVTFPESTAAWVGGANLTHALFFDAATAGNLIRYAALETARSVTASGVRLYFPAGEIKMIED